MTVEVGGPSNWKRDTIDESAWLLESVDVDQLIDGVAEKLENGPGVVLLRGAADFSNVNEEEAKQAFLTKMSRVGTAVSQSATGDRVFSVRDAGFKDDDARARGPNTKKKLSFHTDRCDVIAFLCLRQAKTGGENQVVSSVAIYNEIRERRPRFACGPDATVFFTSVTTSIRATLDRSASSRSFHSPMVTSLVRSCES